MSDIDFFTLLKDPPPTLRQRLTDVRLWVDWLLRHRHCDYCGGRQSYGDWTYLGACGQCWDDEMQNQSVGNEEPR